MDEASHPLVWPSSSPRCRSPRTSGPAGHSVTRSRTCTIATALAETMGCDPNDVRTVHQFALLRFLGCTSDAAETAALAGGDDRAFNAAMAPVLMGSGREMLGAFVRSVAPASPTRGASGSSSASSPIRRARSARCRCTARSAPGPGTALLALFVFTSALGEELLFRGYLLARMNGAFGRGDWVANGLLFTG